MDVILEQIEAECCHVMNDKIEVLCKEIEKRSTELESSLDENYQRNTGSYYTGLRLARYMVEEMFSTADEQFLADLPSKTFLEPCVGTGHFVFAYLLKIYTLNYSMEDISKILDNIYVCDINQNAVSIYKEMLSRLTKLLWGIELDDSYFKKNIGGPLLYNLIEDSPSYVSLSEVFGEQIASKKFDIIVTNPPYKNLRAEKQKFSKQIDYECERRKYLNVSKDARNRLFLSSFGVINLYRLFLDEIIISYANDNALISVLVPSTILSDRSCEKLRTYILEHHDLISINMIKENNDYINAQQSLCTLLIHKGKPTEKINIVPDFCANQNNKVTLQIGDVMNESTGNAIFALTKTEQKILRKLRNFPSLGELDFITNMRGELDLTANAESISEKETFYPLLRGRNIGFFKLNGSSTEWVEQSFVENSSKRAYISQPRIICQQVVNIHKDRRVSFAYVDGGYVLGNSCNFLSIDENEYGLDLYSLLGLFNSPVINWFFKLTSTNNHINNYEIDNFPIPINDTRIKLMSGLVKEYLESQDEGILQEIIQLGYLCYDIELDNEPAKKEIHSENTISFYLGIKNLLPGVSLETAKLLLDEKIEIDTVLTTLKLDIGTLERKSCEHLLEKFRKSQNNELYNHTTFKLSDLDMEMIRAVPPGGNWRNIPKETVVKSQRLVNITKSGGRTTLYGRIAYDQPSYTITTFFNRPGNGTYVHPSFNRVLSVREAARLQSFPDDYYFFGNQRQLLQQVGNAVPPLLAYHIGKSIVKQTGCGTSLDLFSGAGGMTLGFKESGISCVLGVDKEESACVTLKANNPEIQVLCGDITQKDVKDEIVDVAKNKGVDIICGGPPCQGFSHAGKRFVDDPRNQLFKEFIEIVSRVRPKIVVMENVEGMITIQKGAVYREILELFTELGYACEGRKLLAHQYGVPQKRKRVIIIGTKEEVNIEPGKLFPEVIFEKDTDYINAFGALYDLESIQCNENAQYCSTMHSDYVREMRRAIKFGSSSEQALQKKGYTGQLTLF